MSKILELADAYAKANRAEANVLEQGTADELVEACNDTRQARAALVAEVEKLEKDAARYRWLLDYCGFGIRKNGVIVLSLGFVERHPEFIGDMDAAIDAAMEVANEQGN